MKRNKYIIFVALIFIGAITSIFFKQKAYQDERDFSHYGLIREGAIYTLLGDKPISQFATYLKSDKNRDFTGTSVTIKKIELDKSILTYSEDDHFKKDISKLWKKWKNSYKLSSKTFSLVHLNRSETGCIFLVNKPLVKQVLEENYELFSKWIQREFDVDKTMNEIDDPRSLFWTHIMNCEYGHICMGLLFGFGIENTLAFQKDRAVGDYKTWGGYLCEEPMEDFFNRWNTSIVSVQNLPIPCYVSFSDPDPIAEHYKQERTRIQQEYKDADLRQLLIDALKE